MTPKLKEICLCGSRAVKKINRFCVVETNTEEDTAQLYKCVLCNNIFIDYNYKYTQVEITSNVVTKLRIET